MRLGEIFSSGMVFAAKRPIKIFGYGMGEASVTFAGITKNVISESEKWCVEFPPMEYGGAYELAFTENGNTVLIDDIYIGEVYLFSGQSNMAFKLYESNAEQSAYQADERLRYIAICPADEVASWERAGRENISIWSALGYFVGKEIAENKDIHIGIILCASGATVIESWVPEGTFSKIGINIPMGDKYPDHYKKPYAAKNKDAFLYNTKLSLVIPYVISGVVWYQGESDASVAEGEVYERELCELINVWRADFECADLPFCIVQIADCDSRIALGPGWRMIQDAQAKISEHFPNTYTVVSRDVCESDNIHPPTKDKLAHRIAQVIQTRF